MKAFWSFLAKNDRLPSGTPLADEESYSRGFQRSEKDPKRSKIGRVMTKKRVDNAQTEHINELSAPLDAALVAMYCELAHKIAYRVFYGSH